MRGGGGSIRGRGGITGGAGAADPAAASAAGGAPGKVEEGGRGPAAGGAGGRNVGGRTAVPEPVGIGGRAIGGRTIGPDGASGLGGSARFGGCGADEEPPSEDGGGGNAIRAVSFDWPPLAASVDGGGGSVMRTVSFFGSSISPVAGIRPGTKSRKTITLSLSNLAAQARSPPLRKRGRTARQASRS